MPLHDGNSQRVDDTEQARVIACDALLRAVSKEAASPFSLERSPNERGLDRLRLLLTMLATSESDDEWPRSERVSAGSMREDIQPLLGRFEVLEHLGSGGFGFVVRARDRLLGRDVALKMPLPERLLNSGDIRRFLREARAAARLDHPNIVGVYDAGEIGPLGYFIASEFCAGPSLRQWLEAQSGPIALRLAAHWVAALADATQHAHERGILHRDIKPDNIVLAVGPDSDDLVPRLTDFGLAKLVEEAEDNTRSQARIGTPHYMAPEQAAGRRGEVGPATDVYALGITLYEVLTGRPAFRGETDADTLRLVLETDPVPLHFLRPGLPRDLETICMKCLRGEPGKRYASAAALRDDLRRFLEGQPIVGRPVSAGERAWCWARRRPTVAALVGLIVLLVCGLLGGTAWWGSWQAWHNHQLEIQIARADLNAREAASHAAIALRHHDAERLRLARRALDAHQLELAQEVLHEIQPESVGIGTHGFAWQYLWRQAHREFSQLWGHESVARDCLVSPDGKMLATRDLQGRVVIWDLAPDMAANRPRTCPVVSSREEPSLSFSVEGRLISVATAEKSKSAVCVFNSVTGQLVTRLDCGATTLRGAALFDSTGSRLVIQATDPAGKRLVLSWNIADGGAGARSWSVDEGTRLWPLPANGWSVVISRGGRNHLLDPSTGKHQVELTGPELSDFARLDQLHSWSADGRVFAAYTVTNDVLLWDTATGRDLAACAGPDGTVRIALSPKGSRLAMLSEHGRLVVFDRSTNRPRVLKLASSRLVRLHDLSFSDDENLLAVGQDTTDGPRAPEVWNFVTGKRVAVFSGRTLGAHVAFLPGSRALFLMDGTRPRIWRLDPPAEPDALVGQKAEAWAARFSLDGKSLAIGSDDTNEHQTIKLWNPLTGRLVAGWKAHTATVSALAFSPDGRLLASGSLDSGEPPNPNVILWDAGSQKRVATLAGHSGCVRSVVFSPDGRLLATAGDDTTVRLWDMATAAPLAGLTGHTQRLMAVAFSPDGKTLASASCDATVRLWDVATRQFRQALADVRNVNAVAFAPGGTMLASANNEGHIRLWNPATGALVRTIRGESDQLRGLTFTPDSQNVVAAGKGSVIRFWDVATGQEMLTLEGHQDQINALAFSPDGTILASCDHKGKVKLWRADPLLDPGAFRHPVLHEARRLNAAPGAISLRGVLDIAE